MTHTYTSGGTNTISLLASGPFGAGAQVRTNYIKVTAPADALRITRIDLAGTNVLISFTTEPGKSYRVEYTDGLGVSPWLTAVDLVPGTGQIVQALHAGGAGTGVRLYRVKLLTGVDYIPSASFEASPTGGHSPLHVVFTDTSVGIITNRFWVFGDGTSTNTPGPTVSRTYTTVGPKTVSLLVSGPFGESAETRTNYITVGAPLVIQKIHISGPNVLVSFPSMNARQYVLEYANTVPAQGWLNASGPVIGTDGLIEITSFGGATNASRFFRIRQIP